jgi:hypothetical protein
MTHMLIGCMEVGVVMEPDFLFLNGAHEALGMAILRRLANGGHTDLDPVGLQHLGIKSSGVLDPLVGVVDLGPMLRLAVCRNDNGLGAPRLGREVFCVDGFCGLERGEDFYLTDGASLFHLQSARGWGEAQLAPSFVEKPAFLQRNFGPLVC